MRRMMMSPKLSCDVWDGETRGPVPEAVNNVITITTGAQLAGLADAVNSGTTYEGYTIRLAADLDLNYKQWTPIGAFANYFSAWNPALLAPFKGIFDGKGHTVKNYVVNVTDKTQAAFFGYVDYPDGTTDFDDPSGGVVKNIRMYGAVANNSVKPNGIAAIGAAGIVGWNEGKVENCYFEGSVKAFDLSDADTVQKATVGGICSMLGNNAYVVNCVVGSNSEVIACGKNFSYAGGIAGYAYSMGSGYVQNCTVSSNVYIYSNMDAAGIVGGFCNKVSNCVCATDNIRASVEGIEGYAANPNESGYFAGGIVGAYGVETNSYWLQTPEYASINDTYKLTYAIGTGTDVSRKKSALPALPAASLLLSKYEAERAAVKLKATIYPVESSEAGQGVAISGQGVAVTPTALPNGGVGVLSLSGAGTVTVTVGGAAAIGPSCEMAVR